MLHEAWATWPGEPDSDEAARRFMFHDCDPPDLEWSLTTVRSFLPRVAYEEITPLTAWPSVQSSYVLGTHDRIVNQEWARQVVPERLGIEPREVDTGHCPQNSRPELLAEILLELSAPASCELEFDLGKHQLDPLVLRRASTLRWAA